MKPGLEFDLVTYSVCNMISVFLSVRCVQALSSVCVSLRVSPTPDYVIIHVLLMYSIH